MCTRELIDELDNLQTQIREKISRYDPNVLGSAYRLDRLYEQLVTLYGRIKTVYVEQRDESAAKLSKTCDSAIERTNLDREEIKNAVLNDEFTLSTCESETPPTTLPL